MELTEWIVMLAVALLAIVFFCRHATTNRSLGNRTRRITATRLLVQAALSLWGALLLLVRGLLVLDGLPGIDAAPHIVIAGAAVLAALGCYWSVRGSKLLKPRRLFTAC